VAAYVSVWRLKSKARQRKIIGQNETCIAKYKVIIVFYSSQDSAFAPLIFLIMLSEIKNTPPHRTI